MAAKRAQWGSKIGFILAAAGSAVGLGNIWKFPYVTGQNGGGAFVLLYLLAIALVGLPIMMGEILIGRMAQTSTVTAFRTLAPRSGWPLVGWLGVIAGMIILSYYSVVAGWSLHYIYLSLTGAIGGADPEAVKGLFGSMYGDVTLNVFWHAMFMIATAVIVIGGVQQGVERAATILMPALFLMMTGMLIYAMTLPGFGEALDFIFGFRLDQVTGATVLEALGQSFFTLSLGMGAMLTYGSYLSKQDDLVGSAISISVLDTSVALMASLVLFPITFTLGIDPAGGPGLVFQNMPAAFAQLPGGAALSTVFFVLLSFAALTSSISLLEVVAAYFIDERGWTRRQAVVVLGTLIFALGVPSALSGGTALFGARFSELTTPLFGLVGKGGMNWFDTFDYVASNLLLPLGGLGIALFSAWRIGEQARRAEIAAGSTLGALEGLYLTWLQLLRYLVPLAIITVMLYALGIFELLGLI
ncbi:MAG: sodium-dependent transporter [Myxococcales bacterium]|nr:sodium-dependent transporter [Myxococcales bacterium]